MNDEAPRPCPGLTRRGIFRLACAASAGAVACMGPGGNQPTGPIAAGNIKDLPPSTFRVMGDVVLARDAAGIYAMSAVCTHAGCATRASGGGLFCPCHGSLFDQDGNVTRGPARSPLPHFQVDLAPDGAITVQASTIVSAATRLPPG
jgi:Rieske Fe-S protein